MSNIIQNKLLHYEVTPPEGVWMGIDTELEETSADKQLATKLANISITPPSGLWTSISAALSDTADYNSISAKMLAAEVLPPAGVWQHVSGALDSEKEVVAPKQRRLSPMLRYAAAAVVTGVIAFGALQLFNADKPKGSLAADQKNTIAEAIRHNSPDVSVVSNDESSLAVADPDEARNDAALEESKHTYAKLDIRRSNKAAIASGFHFSNNSGPGEPVDPCTSGCDDAATDINPANRYFLLMTPEGHVIRMSKKLSNMVCCVSGEEADAQCKSQLEKWRKQLACSETSHPGNFLDILSLVGSLQQNQ